MELNAVNIVIVDDHELFSLGIKALIAAFIPREQITIMHDGKDFIAYIEKGNKVDLLLLDLQMPYMDGKSVIRYLNHKSMSIKIIIISMHNDAYVINECKELGAHGFIKKDSSTVILEDGITQVLLGHKYFPSLTNTEFPYSEIADLTKTYGLTKREIEIIKMIKNNYSSHRIAEILHISYQTVKTHRKNINHKLEINNVVALIDFATKHKL